MPQQLNDRAADIWEPLLVLADLAGEDWPKLEELAKEHGLIEGTTFETLPFNKLHWGCRHEFTPGILTDAQRRAISSPLNN